MIEEPPQVDDSVLASLTEMRSERDALRQRLTRMQEAASEVSEQVLARVRSDYEARIAALDEKAAPLKQAARAEHGRLTPMLDKAREACEVLRLDGEEIELRHKLGEYADDEYREKAAESGESLRAAEDHAASIADRVTRFRGAFDSADEVAPATPSQVGSPLPPPAPAAAEMDAAPAGLPWPGALPLDEAKDEDGTLMLPPESPPAPAPPPPPESAPEPPVWSPSAAWTNSPGATPEEAWRAAAAALAEDEPALIAKPAAAPAPMLATPKDEPEAEVPTGYFTAPHPAARARLEALDADLEPQPHFLEPLTFIGRTPENQIRIYKPAVSRRHAQITETDAGWMLRDLSSENGTYVNGQRISERLLVEGDRVQFGTSRFVLRLDS
ncbi:MAG: FHA domain-containing protein [Thermoanaerobaculia bacterium]